MDLVARYRKPVSDPIEAIAMLNPQNYARIGGACVFTIDMVAFLLVLNEEEMVLMAGSGGATIDGKALATVDDVLRTLAFTQPEMKTMKLGDMLMSLDLVGMAMSDGTLREATSQELETLQTFGDVDLTFTRDALPLRAFPSGGDANNLFLAPREGHLKAAQATFTSGIRHLMVETTPLSYPICERLK